MVYYKDLFLTFSRFSRFLVTVSEDMVKMLLPSTSNTINKCLPRNI